MGKHLRAVRMSRITKMSKISAINQPIRSDFPSQISAADGILLALGWQCCHIAIKAFSVLRKAGPYVMCVCVLEEPVVCVCVCVCVRARVCAWWWW